MQSAIEKPGYKRTKPYNVRNALREDFDKLRIFSNIKFNNYIGSPKRKELTKHDFFGQYGTHFLMITESKQSNVTIGFAEFGNYPTISALPRGTWVDWMNRHFCVDLPLSPVNCLFLNTFIFNKSHLPELFFQLLEEILYREPKVQYILILQMPDMEYSRTFDIPNYEWLYEITTIYYPTVFEVGCQNVQCIHVIERDEIIEEIAYRKALPGDNDDIIGMMDNDCPLLRKELGDFYIAEELLHNATGHTCLIVCEIQHKTIGFFWLNDNVDLIKLITNFELEMYGNLLRFDPTLPILEVEIPLGVHGKVSVPKLFSLKTMLGVLEKTILVRHVPNSKVSGVSIFSNQINIVSRKGSISIPDERFFMLEEYFVKIQKIHDKFLSSDYYFEPFDGIMELNYNIPEDYDPDNLYKYKPEETSNVFAIQLFTLDHQKDVRKLSSYLAASFSSYPNCEYCLVSVPRPIKKTIDLKELLKYCVPIKPRPNCTIPDQLYLLHHSSLYGELIIHQLRGEDVEHIDKLLLSDHIDSIGSKRNKNIIQEIIVDVIENYSTEFTFYVIRCGMSTVPLNSNQIVGFAAIREFTEIKELSHHFFIRDRERKSLSAGELVTLYLHPFYHFEHDTIFRELGRLSSFAYLYYFAPNEKNRKPLVNDLIRKMQPIEPKLIKTFDCNNTSVTKTNTNNIININYMTTKFALYRRCMRETIAYGDTNQNIVIIGFTDVAKAFLRSLIFSYNSSDMNCIPQFSVTVIAQPGVIEADFDVDFQCKVCNKLCWTKFHNHSAYIEDCIKRLELHQWIHLTSAHITSINRKQRMISIHDGCSIPYDTLILCCYTDYGILNQNSENVNLPANYAQFNNRLDKLIFYHKLNIINKEEHILKILVYGRNIRTYEFINFLIEHGFKGKSIILAIPDATNDIHILNLPDKDENIEFILQQMVVDLSVQILYRLKYKYWNLYSKDDFIKSVVFESLQDKSEVTINCDIFVSFQEVHIEDQFINVLKNAHIDMDRRDILVDKNFCTNDPNIYAVGKFIQHYNEENHQYINVSPKEMAQKLLVKLNLNPYKTKASRKFREPHYFQAQLPFDYYMFKVVVPKRYIANHLPNEFGFSMSAYDKNFSRMRLNEHSIVEELVYITRNYADYDFLNFFCGQHETMLNNIRSRWYLGEIDNLIEFLRQPWSQLLMTKKFKELMKDIRTFVKPNAKLFINTTSNANLERRKRKELFRKQMLNSGITANVESLFLDYLRKRRNQMPHKFALPEDFPKPFF